MMYLIVIEKEILLEEHGTVMDGEGNSIHSKDRFTAVLGVDNVIVVNTGDVVLVVDKDKVEDIKNLVHYLNNNQFG